MALKFDMSSPQWARMAAYQQQQKMASTLGEDIGTAIGLGAAGIASKAKKRWGKDWKKAVDEGKTKTGDWKEYKQEVRNRKRQDKVISRMQKDEQFKMQMDKDWAAYKAKNPDGSKRLSRKDWDRQNVDKYSDRFKDYKQSQRKEKFDAFGDKVKGVAGAGLGLAAAPFAITGGALANLFKKKDKSEPITYSPSKDYEQNPFIGDNPNEIVGTTVTDKEQAEHTKGYVSEGDPTDVNQTYRDDYNVSGRAPTFEKTQSDYYTRGPVSMRTGKLAREEGMKFVSPLVNPNTNLGFPSAIGGPGLSTGTEEEMLRNRELDTGASDYEQPKLIEDPDPLGQGYGLDNQSGKSILMGRGDATPGTLVGDDGSSQDSTKDMSAIDQQKLAMVKAQYGKDWENTASFADKKRIQSFLDPSIPLAPHYQPDQGSLGMLGEAIGDTGQFYLDKAQTSWNPFYNFGTSLGNKLYDFYND